ncbi:uncharacterized protein LOC118757205, partial [Rhagoletis pomonella]|uniref:uncharacterized protein LOC118757205 n=1 Tax=Rhagoletis pomonella TaxID=28610 RepID=UPI00177BC7CA
VLSQLEAQKTHVTSQLETQDLKITQLQEKTGGIETEVDAMKARLCELQLNRPNVLTSGSKVKAPSFDGTVSFSIFKLQFETTATTNNWGTADKVAALVVSFKGSAAEVLQTVPEIDRGNYDAIMAAIERRYGSDHRQQMFQMELMNRFQKINETLQDYATEIERLAHLAYAKETADFIEKMKCQAFVRGIRDPETKRAAYSTPKGTFAETMSFALAQETAALLSKPVHRVHRVDVEEPNSLEETIRDVIRESLSQMTRRGSSDIKCYNCGKIGHISRNCSTPHSQSKANSGGRKRSSETDNTAPEAQQPLN